MLTPLKELGTIHHTLILSGKPFAMGQRIKGEFIGEGGTYFGDVLFVGDGDAVVEIINHTRPSQFKKGERVRFIFQ